LIPIQVAQARLARAFENGGEISERYWRLNRQWYVWGIAATVLPLLNLYVMVHKGCMRPGRPRERIAERAMNPPLK
jgi:uncharacterized membrane protein